MRITGIRIENFRGIDTLQIEFGDPVGTVPNMIVFAGPNGSGKTSILEACILALGKDDLLQARRSTKDNVRKGSMDFKISLTVQHAGKEHEIIRTSKDRRPNHTQDTLDLESFPVEYFSSWRYPKLVGSVSVTAGRRGRRPEQNEENRLWRLKQYLVNLTATKAFESSGQTKLFQEESEAYQTINRLWNYFYPEKTETFVAKQASEDVTEGFDLFLKGRGSNLIPLDALSSGEIEILTLLGQSLNKSFSKGIIFIDEPELHMHPAWHRSIIAALREVWPETQIISATHSPQVIGYIPAENVILIRKENEQVRAVRPEDAYGLDISKLVNLRRGAIDGILYEFEFLTHHILERCNTASAILSGKHG